jgi:hypothetical protein
MKRLFLLYACSGLAFRKAENALANNVVLNLAGATTNGSREGIQIGALPKAAIDGF